MKKIKLQLHKTVSMLCIGSMVLYNNPGVANCLVRPVQAEESEGETAVTEEEIKYTEDGFEYTENNKAEVTIIKYTGDNGDVDIAESFPEQKVVKIEGDAFTDSSIYRVVIPASVKTIGEGAFSYCESLVEVTWQEGSSQLRAIAANTFDGCKALYSITLPDTIYSIGSSAFCNTALGEIVIPENCVMIGEFAFMSCNNLKEVTVPVSCKSIGEYAFCDCDLDSMFFKGKDTVINTVAISGATDSFRIIGEPDGKVQEFAETNGYTFNLRIDQLNITQTAKVTDYVYGQEYNAEGLVLQGVRQNEDGESEQFVVPLADCKVIGYDSQKYGNQTIVYYYGGQSVSYNIYVYNSIEDITTREPVTTESAATTTKEPVTTTESTTTQSSVTTESVATTTKEPATTTESTTTQAPITTESAATTKEPATPTESTTTQSTVTTESATTTTKEPATSTESTTTQTPVTTESAATTTKEPATTTETQTTQALVTTESATTATKEPATTTETQTTQALVTSESAATTTKEPATTQVPATTTEPTTTQLPATTQTQPASQTSENVQTAQTEPTTQEPVTWKIGQKFKKNKLCYKITSKNTVTMYKLTDKKAKKVIIPDTVTYQGTKFKVTKVGKKACYKHKNLNYIEVGDKVTTIEAMAFANCKKVKKVWLGVGIKKIQKKAFCNDNSVIEFRLKSKKVNFIGKKALQGIWGMKKCRIYFYSAEKLKKLYNRNN